MKYSAYFLLILFLLCILFINCINDKQNIKVEYDKIVDEEGYIYIFDNYLCKLTKNKLKEI